MIAGAEAEPGHGEIVEIGDRQAAIAAAVARAQPGDVVVVAGKGHETGQEVRGVKHPFDDAVELASALRGSASGGSASGGSASGGSASGGSASRGTAPR
jgi:UDP-N-acetylmuramoyl-L-alanyl-D-glutamate--2,6-diaminopimelate ligase